ncbi:MAG TPA: MFS transporter [Afifellaceae bacterium]|nr:MFS transporter [Afifellaceae bacterium]
MLPMFMAMVDQTIIAAALPAIGADLGSVDRLTWVVVGYLVAATVAAPVYGRLGDVFGRRRLLFVALCLAVPGSLLCAVATSVEALAAARMLQGLGGGGLMTLAQALIGETIPPRERARYQGYLAGVAVVSSTFGPVVGGLLTEWLGWRSVFLFNLPVGLLAAGLALRLPGRAGSGGPFRFDVPGLLLFAVFISSVLATLQLVQRVDAALLRSIGALALLAIVACALLVWREKRAPHPLLPLGVLGNPSIWRSDALAAMHGAMLVSLMTFAPIYYRVVHGSPASEIGLLVLPMTAGIGIGAMATGRTISRTGYTAIFPAWGLMLVVLILAGLAFNSDRLPALAMSVGLGVAALFMGTVMTVVQVTVQSAAGQAMLGSAAASVQFSRSLGAALGTATVGAVLFASIVGPEMSAAEVLSLTLQASPEAWADGSPERLAAARQAVAAGFRFAFLTVACFGLVGIALAWTIPLRRI